MNFSKMLENKKVIKVAVAVGIIGVLLIFLSDFIKIEEKPNAEASVTTSDDYAKQLSADIESLVKSITGDQKVSALVTLENGTEYIYATEKNINTDVVENRNSSQNYNNQTSDKSEESYIIIKTDAGEQPLLLATIAPTVKGVAIVLESGNDEMVAEKVRSAVCVLLDVPESKVNITGIY